MVLVHRILAKSNNKAIFIYLPGFIFPRSSCLVAVVVIVEVVVVVVVVVVTICDWKKGLQKTFFTPGFAKMIRDALIRIHPHF